MKKRVLYSFKLKIVKCWIFRLVIETTKSQAIPNVPFLGLKIDNFLTWKDYIDVLIDKLNRSCFAIRSVKSILSLETLKMVYYSYVHSILNYG
jgi:hypothetical protein